MAYGDIKKNLINDDLTINKSQLMKRAWQIAGHEFYDVCIWDYVAKMNSSEKFRRDLLSMDIRQKSSFMSKPHVVAEYSVDCSKKDFLSAAMRQSWREAKSQLKTAIEKNLDEIEAAHKEKEMLYRLENSARINKNAPRREMVPADKYSIGDKIFGFVITGLGVTFRPAGEISSVHHLGPEVDRVQYAYFN